MDNNINNLPPIPVPNYDPGQLMHSVQMYWYTIGGTLTDVLHRIGNNLDQAFILNVINAISTAYACADMYHHVIINRHDQIIDRNYQNNENVFYNQLRELIYNNNHFANELQNLVRTQHQMGTRYFVYFLDVVGVEPH